MMGSNHGKIEKVVYGEDEETQFMNLHYPTNSPSSPPPYPVVIILHGGYWKNKYGVENSGIGGLAPFFASHGAIAVEIEYRRRDHEGGGYPGTAYDVRVACGRLYDHLCSIKGGEGEFVNWEKVVMVGHSAGGYLALHTITTPTPIIPSNEENNEEEDGDVNEEEPSIPFTPCHVIALAPVIDLIRSWEERVSDEGDAIELFMKGKTPETHPLTYHQASIPSRLPFLSPTTIFIGSDDKDVPPHLILEFRDCFITDRDCDSQYPIEVIIIDEANHFTIVDPTHSHFLNDIWSTIQPYLLT